MADLTEAVDAIKAQATQSLPDAAGIRKFLYEQCIEKVREKELGHLDDAQVKKVEDFLVQYADIFDIPG